MLIDLSHAVGAYLHDVFVTNLDWWVVLGFVAQGLFTMRFAVQWIASERVGRSVVPMAFWWFSISGGVLLLLVPAVIILHQGVVMREEDYLSWKFGDAYRQYMSEVPRWL